MTAQKRKYTSGQRIKHFAFGLGTIDRCESDSVLINLDAKEIEYYVMGKGRVKMKGKKGEGIKTLFCKTDELLGVDEQLSGALALRATCLAVKILA